jgi:hypothetical protein
VVVVVAAVTEVVAVDTEAGFHGGFASGGFHGGGFTTAEAASA